MFQAWVNDRLVPADQATISVFDRGFRTGEGVFETLRAYAGFVFRLDDHLARAAEGAAFLGFDLPPLSRVRSAVRETARANLSAVDGSDAALRLSVTPGALDPASPFPGRPTGGPTLVVTAHPLAIPPTLYEAGVSAWPVPWVRELPHVKALSYLAASLARQTAAEHGADEALLTDRDGHVVEGSASNLFAVVDGQLVTPPVSAGILAGVTRAVALEVAEEEGLKVVERLLTADELAAADEAFLTATTREIVPLVRVAGTTVGDGRPGPRTRQLHAAYRRAVERERDT